MTFVISGPTGSIAEDGTDDKVFGFVRQEMPQAPYLKQVIDKLYSIWVMPPSDVLGLMRELRQLKERYRQLHPVTGVRAQDPEVRAELEEKLREKDPVDQYISNFLKLAEDAVELHTAMEFVGD
jgi:hypothetical protein